MQALAVALQHPAVAADQRNICTLLQVDRAWSAAVQKSAASRIHVRIDHRTIFTSRVISLSQWLAKHPGLVHTLDISNLRMELSAQETEFQQTVRQLIELSLKANTAGNSLSAPLRLQSFKLSAPAGGGLLAALPAAMLTHLDLSLDRSNWFSTLCSLTNLRYLCLGINKIRADAADTCLQEVATLQQLTQLVLQGIPDASNMHLIPVQLQQLELKCRRDSVAPQVVCD